MGIIAPEFSYESDGLPVTYPTLSKEPNGIKNACTFNTVLTINFGILQEVVVPLHGRDYLLQRAL